MTKEAANQIAEAIRAKLIELARKENLLKGDMIVVEITESGCSIHHDISNRE